MADFAKELSKAFEITQKQNEEIKNKEEKPSNTDVSDNAYRGRPQRGQRGQRGTYRGRGTEEYRGRGAYRGDRGGDRGNYRGQRGGRGSTRGAPYRGRGGYSR